VGNPPEISRNLRNPRRPWFPLRGIGCGKKEEQMGTNDLEEIKIAREYLMRSDKGRPDILELFHE